jgi:hypothetical protein
MRLAVVAPIIALVALAAVNTLSATAAADIPVTVYGCTPVPVSGDSLETTTIRISYEVTAAKLIQAIRFRILNGHVIFGATDSGLRKQGETVEHALFVETGTLYARDSTTCSVAYIRYVDGTEVIYHPEGGPTPSASPGPTLAPQVAAAAQPDLDHDFCTVPGVLYCDPPSRSGIRTELVTSWYTNPPLGPDYLLHIRIEMEFRGGVISVGRFAHFNAFNFFLLASGTKFVPTTLYEDERQGGIAQNERFGDGVLLSAGQSAVKVLTFGPFNKVSYPHPEAFTINETAPLLGLSP